MRAKTSAASGVGSGEASATNRTSWRDSSGIAPPQIMRRCSTPPKATGAVRHRTASTATSVAGLPKVGSMVCSTRRNVCPRCSAARRAPAIPPFSRAADAERRNA